MTNGEKIKEIFPGIELYEKSHDALKIKFNSIWWNAEYKEPTTKNNLGVDCISRDSAIKALDYDIKCFEFKRGVNRHMDDIAKLLNTIYETQANNIKALPSVTPQLSSELEKNSKKLEKNFGELDCVSRKAVLEITAETGALETQNRVKALPPVTSIRPKGHWIDKNHLFETCSAECSSCHKRSNGYVYDNGFSLECKYYDFCPKCGADMREVEE